jgi:NitT/TauT family transport system permease protein
VGAAVAAIVSFAREFRAPYLPAIQIDLAPRALPHYALYSLVRGVTALTISYLFAFGFGLAAASSRAAERLLLPLLDILQSIPVLGFLPGLVLGLVAVFPGRNTGLELAAILMIFTAQAWNLALSFYQSLISVPEPLREACRLSGWRRWETFRRLEVPAAAQGLIWNGMLSMAGGWFFLMVNESFQLGNHDFRLPGIGSYMSVAVERGDREAMVLAILAMIAMIVAVDRLFWRPLVVWGQRFRLDDSSGEAPATNWLLDLLGRSRLPWHTRRLSRQAARSVRRATLPLRRPLASANRALRRLPVPNPGAPLALRIGGLAALAALAIGGAWGAWKLFGLIGRLDGAAWVQIIEAAALTFARVMIAVFVSTAWALPAGILIGRTRALAEALQPVIQVVASFPAPMLFPIVVVLLERVGMGLGVGAIVLLILSCQWYILFNVIAAVAALPPQLKEATDVFAVTGWRQWRELYLPAAFPSLVTGWVTAAGGAWNGSIVAEYLQAGGRLQEAPGLGSLISEATAAANFPLLAGGIVVMSAIVVIWNRSVWRPAGRLAQTRFGTTQ